MDLVALVGRYHLAFNDRDFGCLARGVRRRRRTPDRSMRACALAIAVATRAVWRRRSPRCAAIQCYRSSSTLHVERGLPEPVEVAAYYVVSEAMTNAAKHAHALLVNVELDTHEEILRSAMTGGGADPLNDHGGAASTEP
jgi:signal transduction histidine kinase